MKHATDDLDLDDLVSASPDTRAGEPMDDLKVGLAKADRTPWLTRSTRILFALVLVLGGFLAGVGVQKGYGTTGTATGAPTGGRQGGFTGQFPGGTGLGTGAGSGTGTSAAAPITGKIKLIDGTTVYLETEDGRTMIVKTTDATKILSAEEILLKALKSGASITVQGTTSGTTLTATTITATS